MLRVVTYKGAVVARFEWVGVREQDVESAAREVEAAFAAWPAKLPTTPRFHLVCAALSAAALAPCGRETIEATNHLIDKAAEQLIEAAFLQARGLGKLERIYKRERAADRWNQF